MKRMPQPIPYQGSKRNIAPQILSIVPTKIDTLIEPFAGSAAVSIRAAYMNKARRFRLNDLNKPLMDLLELIINKPDVIAAKYEQLWTKQLGQERIFYDEVRTEFNKTGRPELFLYLLARCVKASVRYNSNGEFNQAPDNRRKGRQPNSMREEIFAVSQLLKDKTEITSRHFISTLDNLNPTSDIVYMDPPYQGTSGGRDSRYCSGIDVSALIDFISDLNAQNAMFILSYEGWFILAG
ncbi:DNA adenine methylase [Chloroflexi bacterium TSY]|nr:DNA adenine methylase [Chloroflexi bacterium TSY]